MVPDGQPIILTHGWGPNSTSVVPCQTTQRSLPVIVWDLPGLGKSSKPKNNDYSLENMPVTWNPLLLLGKVILLGHLGGEYPDILSVIQSI